MIYEFRMKKINETKNHFLEEAEPNELMSKITKHFLQF